MADALIIGDSMRSSELRHEVPIAIPDPLLYAEVGGKRLVAVSSMEKARIDDLGTDLEVHALEEFGYDELIARGLTETEFWREVWLAAARGFGVQSAVVPTTFPTGHADYLRASGIELTVDQPEFAGRRRVKNEAELEGIRRACRAAEAGMRAGLELLRAADRASGQLVLDGEQLTCERVKQAVERAFGDHGAAADEFIVSHGSQTAVGHDHGLGPDRRERHRPLRPLSARSRDGLLRGLHPHLLDRPGAGRDRRVPPARRRRRSTSRSLPSRPG